MRRGIIAATVVLSLAAAGSAQAAIVAHGSAKQIWAVDLEPGTSYELVNGAGDVVRTKKADAQGGLLFRAVKPGDGYRVRKPGGEASDPVTVLTTDPTPPSTDIYDQEIPSSGYGYITMRDGTKLAIYVRPPQDVTNAAGAKLPPVPSGPTPTLIEYAGYGYADPAGPQSGIAIVGNLMGFTVVNVNMRGTGCSGGAFDFFEPMQSIDGYDIIETVARQPWVAHNKVGMMGISYGGISQLFVGATNPPSLAALTPISLIDQVQTTLFPGGILNTGFALEWAKDRVRDARPAGPGDEQGQRWAWKRIQEGDQVCAENQKMHGQAVDLLGKIKRNRVYRPKVADPLSPVTFVDKIKVPTFLACQWQDEQTGGHCPTLAARLTGTDKKWVTFTNGTHVDSLAPETANRWYDFLQLYVAKQAPAVNSARLQAAAPVLYEAAMGIEGVTAPPDPIQQEPTYEGALAKYEALPPVRVLFENGAGDDPGKPYPRFEATFDQWPPPNTTARTWYLGAGGALAAGRTAAGTDSFRWDTKARGLTNFTGDSGAGENGIWTAVPTYEWMEPPDGTGVSYVSEALTEDTVVVGAGRLDLWLRASRRDVDLQATVTEVRPDGKEVFVQGGWLRASMRKLDKAKSTLLAPTLSLRERDIRPVPAERFTRATIPLYYQGHAYRKGSRIRVYVTAPNGDQPIWAFKHTGPRGGADVDIARGGSRPSRLVLPVVGGIEVPAGLPPCPSLRAQPCREYAGG